MTIPSHNGYSQRSVVHAPAGFEEGGPGLEDYLANSTQELETLTELVNKGELLDRASRDWMLDQVDFIVEIIGNEDLELGDEIRSHLLQLLLGIANLNEQVRSQTSLSL